MAKDEKSKEKKGTSKKEKKALIKEAKTTKKETVKSLKMDKKNATTKEEKREIKKKIKDAKHVNSKKGTTLFSQVIEEMKLVRWPNAKEVVKYSIASLIFIVIFALFFFGIDVLFTLVKELIK